MGEAANIFKANVPNSSALLHNYEVDSNTLPHLTPSIIRGVHDFATSVDLLSLSYYLMLPPGASIPIQGEAMKQSCLRQMRAFGRDTGPPHRQGTCRRDLSK